MEFLKPVINSIEKKGGRSMLIGGSVIDRIQERSIKDWDIEVFALSCNELHKILEAYGKQSIVGKSLRIIKINIEGIECDFSIPRAENEIGKNTLILKLN